MARDINKNGNFESDEIFYYVKNHLNSVTELFDHTGDIYQRYTYSAYGETKIAKHNPNLKLIPNRYAYTSREIDEHTGLYYYRARWYDPHAGRFVSEDPIGFESQDSNLYRYVDNNPIYFRDYDGNKKGNPFDSGAWKDGGVGATIGDVINMSNGMDPETLINQHLKKKNQNYNKNALKYKITLPNGTEPLKSIINLTPDTSPNPSNICGE